MDIDFKEISYLANPCPLTLHADYQQFLLSLTGPTVIDISGKNTKRWRVIVTLINGNEPSGLIGVHRWLTTENQLPKPETNIRIIIASVEAATFNHLFHHSFLPNGVDLSGCFNQSMTDNPLQSLESTSVDSVSADYIARAELIEHAIREVKPEAIINIHNTPANSPAFAASSLITPNILSLTSYFCDTIILSSIRLGALMEVKFNCPNITIECGSAQDEQAHEVAYRGIARFSQYLCDQTIPQEKSVQILYKPLRMILKQGRELSYNEHDEGASGLTLKHNIEQFNFGGCCEGQMLDWVDEHGLDNVELLNDQDVNVINDYFTVQENRLICRSSFKIFMATQQMDIAIRDCLFYVVSHVNHI
jgi:hypothetical protein